MTELGLNFQNWDEFFEKIPFTFFMTSQIQKKYIETIKANTPDGGKLLEIAGGSGYTSAVVADVVRTKNGTVTFSDLEQTLTDKVKDNFDSIVNLDFKAADAFKLPFEDDSYDVMQKVVMLRMLRDQIADLEVELYGMITEGGELYDEIRADVEEMLEDPETDAIVVATRHNTHAEAVLKALKAGKSVFIKLI